MLFLGQVVPPCICIGKRVANAICFHFLFSSKRPRIPSHFRNSSRRHGWWLSLKNAFRRMCDVILHAMRSWRRKASRSPTKRDSPAVEDLENVFKSDELPSVAEAKLPQHTLRTTNNVAPSRPRHKSGRKGKSQQTDCGGKRGSRSAPPSPVIADDPSEKEEVPWSPPENLDYEKEKKTLRASPHRKLRSASSSSSLESSRSRGSSLSSVVGECGDKNKTQESKAEGTGGRVVRMDRL